MMRSRLVLVFLVLLQSGLMAKAARAQTCTVNSQCQHNGNPHVHAHQMLDLTTDAEDESEHDRDHHDADAIDVSGLATVHSSTQSGELVVALPPTPCPYSLAGFAAHAPFLIGLPPSTAGPPRQLYLTFCSFRN